VGEQRTIPRRKERPQEINACKIEVRPKGISFPHASVVKRGKKQTEGEVYRSLHSLERPTILSAFRGENGSGDEHRQGWKILAQRASHLQGIVGTLELKFQNQVTKSPKSVLVSLPELISPLLFDRLSIWGRTSARA